MKKLLIIILFFVITNWNVVTRKEIELPTPKTKLQIINENIKKYCKQYGISESLVKAIIEYESGYDEKCRNNGSSAIGLMQFVKPTGKWIYNSLYDDEYRHYDIPIPTQIQMGCKYLYYLKHKYNNNEELMLIEYSGNSYKYFERIKKLQKKYVDKN